MDEHKETARASRAGVPGKCADGAQHQWRDGYAQRGQRVCGLCGVTYMK